MAPKRPPHCCAVHISSASTSVIACVTFAAFLVLNAGPASLLAWLSLFHLLQLVVGARACHAKQVRVNVVQAVIKAAAAGAVCGCCCGRFRLRTPASLSQPMQDRVWRVGRERGGRSGRANPRRRRTAAGVVAAAAAAIHLAWCSKHVEAARESVFVRASGRVGAGRRLGAWAALEQVQVVEAFHGRAHACRQRHDAWARAPVAMALAVIAAARAVCWGGAARAGSRSSAVEPSLCDVGVADTTYSAAVPWRVPGGEAMALVRQLQGLGLRAQG